MPRADGLRTKNVRLREERMERKDPGSKGEPGALRDRGGEATENQPHVSINQLRKGGHPPDSLRSMVGYIVNRPLTREECKYIKTCLQGNS